MESKIRTDLAFHIGRLPALEKSVSRLSVLPAGVAIAVGELQNAIAFFRRAEVALATESQPPDDFYPIFRQDIRDCVRLVEEARTLLWVTAFPNKKGEG